MNVSPAAAPQIQAARIRVFIDFWNLTLTMKERETRATGVADPRLKLDWKLLGSILAKRAAEVTQVANYSYEGTLIYASHDPLSADKSFYRWMTSWLNRQPGIQVNCIDRQPKAPPRCPKCHQRIEQCPHAGCGAKMVGSAEKGVDTLIVTDMIRLAWESAYDIAVLASSDRDLIPGVRLLDSRGLKVVQAGFPPVGADLATSCWASFDVYQLRNQIIRP